LRRRGLWEALLVLAVSLPALAHARAHHSDAWARQHFAAAERMREALNGRPAADRTRRDYQRVLNAYRSVYFGAPASSKADPSVVAVAETLVEMGRRFDDDKILHEAIGQYKFLRREYPGSRYRCDGLFTIGEIYKDDLNDPKAARATFEDFLRQYPRNRLADDARHAIGKLDLQAKAARVAEARKTAEKKQSEKNAKNVMPRDARDAADGPGARRTPGNDESPTGAGRLPRVTGIRHWSTPDYTRVAIDVESGVQFSSRRIADPARIFFDLRDTKLASTLVGKSFDVDDGFLKKVRVAEFAPGRTRVVLEVDNLADYDAFLLPNPYRLIIDIHGKDGRAKLPKDAGETALAENDGKLSPRTVSSADADSDSSETNTSSIPDTDATPQSAGANAADEAKVSLSPSAGVVKTLPNGLVKKIVDADEDNSTDTPKIATKRNTADGPKETSSARNLAATNRPVTKKGAHDDTASNLGMREARPTATGDRSLIRALGLKIGKIVIDPGHGGHDTGTIGPNGLEEKDLCLDVGRRLGKLLEARLGAEVVHTRKDDTFIPLETRTAIANKARADLFVSIHANSSHDSGARGVETYYLNFTSSPEALEVAARENAVSEKSIYELQDLVKKIALKEKIEESREFAWDVQQSLHSGLAAKSPAIRDRGVKKAPFIVLIGANMPSILAEISFVSNPTDERRLETAEYRQRIAESLYSGIAKYVNGLSGVKVASKVDKATRQYSQKP
jgi:N-acetylmuramoyl-L-alanine amidase